MCLLFRPCDLWQHGVYNWKDGIVRASSPPFPVLLLVHWLKSSDLEASWRRRGVFTPTLGSPPNIPRGVFIILRLRTRLPPCLPGVRRTFEGSEEASNGELIYGVPLVSAISFRLRHAPVAD